MPNLYQDQLKELAKSRKSISSFELTEDNEDVIEIRAIALKEIDRLRKVVMKHNPICGGGCITEHEYNKLTIKK